MLLRKCFLRGALGGVLLDVSESPVYARPSARPSEIYNPRLVAVGGRIDVLTSTR